MSATTQHASEDQLMLLVFGDEHSHEFQTTSQHVEACPSCQQRIEQLAATPEFDMETRELLSDTPDSSHEFQARSEPEFDPPSHPEMLGRLGRYEIERPIGQGGMGVVFKGYDTELNRPIAIKLLAQHLAHSGPARKRFSREARASAAVVNEHVVAIHNVETNAKTPYLVMQFVAGESLQARVDREGPLSPREILRVASQAAAGLQAAHEQGVVHRDVKPGNIMLEEGIERALVADFGLAQTVDDATLTQTGVVAGTPHYMSPEQAIGKPTDCRSDIFSLGAVIYFMATGRPPFRAEKAMGVLHNICNSPHQSAWQINNEIPDALSDLIDRCLQKKPNRRFATAAAVSAAALEQLSKLQQRGPRPARSLKRFVRRHTQRMKQLTIAAVAAGCIIGLAMLPNWQTALSPKPQTSPPQVSTPLSTGGATVSPRFSVEVMQQASPGEAESWQRAMAELNADIDQLSAQQLSEPNQAQWQTELTRVHQQVDALQTHLFSP